MSAHLNIESASQSTAAAYASRLVTKAPNWHGLVVLDVLFNNLSTGLFLVAALGELAAPAHFKALAGVAYPIALLLLAADLVCLVLDLGDPFGGSITCSGCGSPAHPCPWGRGVSRRSPSR